MGDYSIIGGGGPHLQTGLTASTLTGTSVTANASTNTKGGWTEFISAANNTEQIGNITVMFHPNTGTQADFLVDVGIGGSGVEEVVIPDLWIHTNNADEGIGKFDFPVSLPTNERISMRCQSSGSSAAIPAWIITSGRSLSQSVALQRVTAYGAATATTDGVPVARNTTPGTFGSWVEIVSSTTNPMKGFIVAAHKDGISWGASGDLRVMYEVAIGGSGSEDDNIIYSGPLVTNNTTEGTSEFCSSFIPIGVAAGQRLAIHANGDVNNIDCDFDYVIYGVD